MPDVGTTSTASRCCRARSGVTTPIPRPAARHSPRPAARRWSRLRHGRLLAPPGEIFGARARPRPLAELIRSPGRVGAVPNIEFRVADVLALELPARSSTASPPRHAAPPAREEVLPKLKGALKAGGVLLVLDLCKARGCHDAFKDALACLEPRVAAGQARPPVAAARGAPGVGGARAHDLTSRLARWMKSAADASRRGGDEAPAVALLPSSGRRPRDLPASPAPVRR